jgi:ketosteroid isomerase-like protein
MRRTLAVLAVTASVLTATGASAFQAAGMPDQQAPAAKMSDSKAAAIADATQAAWASMDANKIDSAYASDIVGFDPIVPQLSIDRANWTKLQQGFAGMKFDHLTVPDRKIQVIDADSFVVSGTAYFTSKSGPLKAMPMRFTDVYRRQADGRFLIVNEHVSAVPAAEKSKP